MTHLHNRIYPQSKICLLIASLSVRTGRISNYYTLILKIKKSSPNNLLWSAIRGQEILVPTKLPKTDDASTQNWKHRGCFKCSAKKCDICQNYRKGAKKFSSLVTKNSYHIKHHLSCNQKNCIYLTTCKKCKLQYVGSPVNFKARWRLHKSHIKQKKIASCRVASHWRGNHQNISDLEIIIIEQVFCKTSDMESLLLTDDASTQNWKHPGYFKCSAKKCDICQNYLKETKTFSSLVTKNSYHIKHHLSCNQKNCIYLTTCKKCKLQYVCSTVNVKARWCLHKSHIKQTKIASCRVASHWCGNHQNISDLEIIIIQQVFGKTSDMESLLLTREIFWQHTLLTFEPYGMNKRDDLYSSRTRF